MKPHIFKSVLYTGLWACVTAQKWPYRQRKLGPVPRAHVVYGTTPHLAYKRWLSWRN